MKCGNLYKRTQTDINQPEIEIAHSFIYSQLSQFNKLTPVSYVSVLLLMINDVTCVRAGKTQKTGLNLIFTITKAQKSQICW